MRASSIKPRSEPESLVASLPTGSDGTGQTPQASARSERASPLGVEIRRGEQQRPSDVEKQEGDDGDHGGLNKAQPHQQASHEENSPTNEKPKVPCHSSRSSSCEPKVIVSRGEERQRMPEKLGQSHRELNQSTKYWHYKRTGVRSRPIKLLKHPIDHLERKILFTYLLAFLFKLITIITGPPIVLALSLFVIAPITLIRHSIWFVLNLSCLCNARIKTRSSRGIRLSHYDSSNYNIGNESSLTKKKSDPKERRYKASESERARGCDKDDKQIYWIYCPLNHIESYWLKPELINHIVLVVERGRKNKSISPSDELEQLKDLIRDKILALPKYRKFLSCIVSRGIPLFKSYYWHYLGPSGDGISSSAEFGRSTTHGVLSSLDPAVNSSSSMSSSSSSSQSSLQFSNDEVGNKIHSSSCFVTLPERDDQNCDCGNASQFRLDRHVFLDDALSKANSELELADVRQYVLKLMSSPSGYLKWSAPLWELRLLRASAFGGCRKSFYLFRCHQSLVDGRTLIGLLRDQLTNAGGDKTASELHSSARLTRKRTKVGDPPGDRSSSKSARNSAQEGTGSDNEHLRGQEHQDAGRKLSEFTLRPVREKCSSVACISRSTGWRSAIFVGPITALLWLVWSLTRRKYNHLNKCPQQTASSNSVDVGQKSSEAQSESECGDERRLYMTHYDLTKLHQIKQLTRSTIGTIVLCALSGAMRDYLRKYNRVSNPPNLTATLSVDMSQPKNSRDERNQIYRLHEMHQKEHNDKSVKTSETLNSCPNGSTINSTGDHELLDTSFVNLPLPISVEGLVPRLWELRGTMDELRNSADPWVMLGLMRLLYLLLPVSYYRRLLNYFVLRNSSVYVSIIRGPQNLVQSWCIDLLQKLNSEAQHSLQSTAAFQSSSPGRVGSKEAEASSKDDSQIAGEASPDEKRYETKIRRKLGRKGRLAFPGDLGELSAIYFCAQPPSGYIAVSFNCISYHNKLFVSSQSRSLLVEDSKLLTRLFFKQLDQLADTIAKRRSMVAIIRLTPSQTPPPSVEISHDPSSPHRSPLAVELELSKFSRVGEAISERQETGSLTSRCIDFGPDDEGQNADSNGYRGDEEIHNSESLLALVKHKDDLEASIGLGMRANECRICQHSPCTCRRRKSLFHFESAKQRTSNLISLLNPNNLIQASRSRNAVDYYDEEEDSLEEERRLPETRLPSQLQSQEQAICACEKSLLEELDEIDEDVSLADEKINQPNQNDNSSAGSRSPNFSNSRLSCPKCLRVTSANRSTQSLATSGSTEEAQAGSNLKNYQRMQHRLVLHHTGSGWLAPCSSREQQVPLKGRLKYSDPSILNASSRDITPSSSQLIVPGGSEGAVTMMGALKPHSRSETDLLPSKVGHHKSPSGLKETWIQIKTRGGRRMSIFSGLTSSGQSRNVSISRITSQSHSKTATNLSGVTPRVAKSKASARRRQSLATTNFHRTVVVKDEMNADVSLRYQVDTPILGLNAGRRLSSTIGNVVVGTQRRSSLIPFGLIHGQNLPKRFKDDEETHV